MVTTKAFVTFPQEYPELLEQMGQLIGRKLVEHGFSIDKVSSMAFDITETIRNEIGGVQQYIPRGVRYQLSKRDEIIFQGFNGRNYHELAHQYNLSEMQIRNIIKRSAGREHEHSATQPKN